jgi:hypothetical protein
MARAMFGGNEAAAEEFRRAIRSKERLASRLESIRTNVSDEREQSALTEVRRLRHALAECQGELANLKADVRAIATEAAQDVLANEGPEVFAYLQGKGGRADGSAA